MHATADSTSWLAAAICVLWTLLLLQVLRALSPGRFPIVGLLVAGYAAVGVVGGLYYAHWGINETGPTAKLGDTLENVSVTRIVLTFGAISGCLFLGALLPIMLGDRGSQDTADVRSDTGEPDPDEGTALAQLLLNLPPAALAAAVVPLVCLILGTGVGNLLHASSYVNVSQSNLLLKLGIAASIPGIVLAELLRRSGRASGAVRRSAGLVTVLYLLVFFGRASRLFAVGIVIVGVVGALSAAPRRRLLRLGTFAVLGVLAIGVPLAVRQGPDFGLFGFAQDLIRDPGAVVTAQGDSINNLLFGVPLSLDVGNYENALPLSDFWASVSPLPSGIAGYTAIQPALRLNQYVPYSGVGELLNYGPMVAGLFWIALGAAVQGLSQIGRRGSRLETTSRLLVGAVASLFLVESLQYNLRNEVRLVYYIGVVLALALLAEQGLRSRARPVPVRPPAVVRVPPDTVNVFPSLAGITARPSGAGEAAFRAAPSQAGSSRLGVLLGRVGRGTLGTAGAQFLAVGCLFLSGPIRAHVLGAAGRGAYAAVFIPVSLAPFLFGFGIREATTRFEARAPGKGYAVSGVLAGAGLGVVFGVVGFVVAGSLGLPHDVTGYLRMAAALLPLWLAGESLIGVAAARGTLFPLSAFYLITGFVNLAVTAALAVDHRLTVRTSCVSLLVLTTLAYVPALAGVTGLPWRRFRAVEILEVTRYGGRWWLAVLAGQGNQRLDQILMISLVTATQLGLYSVSVTYATIPSFLLLGLRFVILREASAGESSAALALVRSSFQAMTLLCIGLIVVTPVGVPLLFGSDFKAAVGMSEVLLVAAIPYCLTALLSFLFAARGRPALVAVSEGGALAASVVAIFVFVPGHGAIAAAWISLASYAVVALVLMVAARSSEGLSPLSLLVPRVADWRILVQSLAPARERLPVPNDVVAEPEFALATAGVPDLFGLEVAPESYAPPQPAVPQDEPPQIAVPVAPAPIDPAPIDAAPVTPAPIDAAPVTPAPAAAPLAWSAPQPPAPSVQLPAVQLPPVASPPPVVLLPPEPMSMPLLPAAPAGPPAVATPPAVTVPPVLAAPQVFRQAGRLAVVGAVAVAGLAAGAVVSSLRRRRRR